MGRPSVLFPLMIARALFATAALLTGSQGHAQNNGARRSYTTLISGAISPVCTVEILSPEALVDVSVRSAQAITQIVYTCNSVDGVTRRITSANNGSLVRGSQAIAYTVSETGAEGLAFSNVRLAAPLVTQAPAFPGLTKGVQASLSIVVPLLPRGLLAGEYSDTLIIEISPN